MSFGETKVYFDGSHYIAIPHTERPTRRRPKPVEELITVIQEESEEGSEIASNEPSISLENNTITEDEEIETTDNSDKKPKISRQTTRKELFEELYFKYINLKKDERKKKIINDMQPYFPNAEHCETFVLMNFERKQRNMICRRVRMCRKANLANFNYFCTFTYDSKLHTEETFRTKLKTSFRHLCERKGWKYMGVWERAPESNRLHFHGLFYIPENGMPGNLIEVKDYDTRSHKMRTTVQCEYFNKRFGRSDFEYINPLERQLGNALAYLMKYIEKTGEKIVYSKRLPQYFISDIMDEDIVCPIGQEDKKLLLFDDFNCWDEGCLMGQVSPEVIAQMRKSD